MKKVFTSLFVLCSIAIHAQIIEGTPCTATYLDPKGKITGRLPNQNKVSPNQYLPCGVGSTEDNPSWYVCTPSGNSLTFSFTTTNCIAGTCDTGVELALWEGSSCNALTKVTCISGVAGILTAAVSPCKSYFLQVDGICESQCNITITYDKAQFLFYAPQPIIEGAKISCVGKELELKATVPTNVCTPAKYKWRLENSSLATITPLNTEADRISIKINKAPSDRKLKLYVSSTYPNKQGIFTGSEETHIIDLEAFATVSANSPVCEGKTAMLQASGGTSYLWTGPNSFSSTLANPIIPNIQTKDAGLYSVVVSNENDNCKEKLVTNLVVENCISNKDIPSKSVQIYPNPFTQQINIDTDDIIKSMTIYNILGQVVFEQQYQDANIMLDLSELNVGYYALNINWTNGNCSKYKLMKQ